jgi:hypothetical protein
MKVNESMMDRIIRVVLGVAFFAVGWFAVSGTLSIVFYVLGAVMLFTAATGFCLIYRLFGLSTKK